MNNYFERKLRYKDVDVWDIRIGEELYRMFIVDENRTTKVEDLLVFDALEIKKELGKI